MVDTTVIENGQFTLKGITEEPFLAFISIPNKQVGQLIVEPGDISFTVTDIKYRAEVGGTPLNDQYNEYLVALNRLQEATNDSMEMIRKEGLKNRTWTYDDESDYKWQYPTELQRHAFQIQTEFMKQKYPFREWYNIM